MIIDCDSCTVRGAACTDCVVTFLTIPVRPAAGTPAPPEAGGADGGGSTAVRGATVPGSPAEVVASRAPVELDEDEQAAIDVLALSGLVPPLRMARAAGGTG